MISESLPDKKLPGLKRNYAPNLVCEFRGCNTDTLEVMRYGDYYDANKHNKEELVKYAGRWFCKEHFVQIKKKVEKNENNIIS